MMCLEAMALRFHKTSTTAFCFGKIALFIARDRRPHFPIDSRLVIRIGRRHWQLAWLHRRERGQFSGNAREDLVPITAPALPEEACGWVPGRILPIHQPAPVRHLLEYDPHRASQRAGEM